MASAMLGYNEGAQSSRKLPHPRSAMSSSGALAQPVMAAIQIRVARTQPGRGRVEILLDLVQAILASLSP